MRGDIRVCVDRYTHGRSPMEILSRAGGSGWGEPGSMRSVTRSVLHPGPVPVPFRLASQKESRWPNGSELTVCFLSGSEVLVETVFDVMKEWTRYANLSFRRVTSADQAALRVDFLDGQGSWSYIGNDALKVPSDAPTINFGWLNESSDFEELLRVVRHETGHAIGCIHEHQSPHASIPWNKEVVYDWYAGAPNFWSREAIDANIFQRYSLQSTNASIYDPTSIMNYPIDPAFITDPSAMSGWNTELSPTDIHMISRWYPLTRNSKGKVA